jgi:hypothetical protein
MTDPQREIPPGYQEQLDLGYVFGGLQTYAQRPFVPDATQLAAWQPAVGIKKCRCFRRNTGIL